MYVNLTLPSHSWWIWITGFEDMEPMLLSGFHLLKESTT
uniref:Uncharacterized protein n=1 Tax=Arundo donax TaxID=35708 RepID=A0A0A9BFZ4_ARUDO